MFPKVTMAVPVHIKDPIISKEGDFFPKKVTHSKREVAVMQNYDAASIALQPSSASTCFSRVNVT